MLGDITIPDNVEIIGDYAFANCSLAHINRPYTHRIVSSKIGEKNEWNQDEVRAIYSDILYNTESVWFTDDVYAEDKGESGGVQKQVNPIKLTIGKGVHTIGAHAFENCRRLNEIVIPDNVKSLGEYAFAGCYRYLDEFCDHDTDGYRTICDGVKKISIGIGLTEIPAHAFENCKALESIEIPNWITKIGDYAFRGCGYAHLGLNAPSEPNNMLPTGGLQNINFGTGVTEIGDYAFAECLSLKQVTIPDNVEKIGAYAFSDSRYTYWPVLYNLGIVNEMDEFSRLDTTAYYSGSTRREHLMTGLRSIDIGNGVTHIGEGAFARSKWLEKVTFGKKVEFIGERAFENCKSLKSISLPKDIPPTNLFKGAGLETLTISASCTEIKADDYLDCPYIKEIVVEEGNTVFTVDQNGLLMSKDKKIVFLAPKTINSVTLPGYVKEIGPYAFAGCADLTSVTLNEGLIAVGAHAFDGCKRLECNSLPENIQTIGDYAFAGCEAAAFDWYDEYAWYPQVIGTIPQKIVTIGDHAFDGCVQASFGPLPETLKSIGSYAFKDCWKMNPITYGDYEFDETSYEGVFVEDDDPKTLYIGMNATGYIDLSRFGDKVKFNDFDVDQDNKYYSVYGKYDDENRLLYSLLLNKEGNTLIMVLFGYQFSGDLSIPEGVITIADHALDSNGHLISNIKIPSTVTTIGDYAFYKCPFYNIIGGEGVRTVGAHAFELAGCEGDIKGKSEKVGNILTFGNLFDNLTTIGDYAFSTVGFCNSSEMMDLFSRGDYPGFFGVDAGSFIRTYGAKIGKKVNSMGIGAFKGTYFADQQLVVPATMTEVPDYAFAELPHSWSNGTWGTRRSEKRTLKIEDGVKKIGAYSFARAFDLLDSYTVTNDYKITNDNNPFSFDVTLPQSIDQIGPAAFMECVGFASINIPRDVTELSDSLFMGCNNLKSIDFSRSRITRIGKEALKDCSALMSITLPETLTEIGEDAFRGCSGLTEIVIPKSVTKIGANAFRGCTNLKIINFPESLIEIGDSAFVGCGSFPEEIVLPDRLTSIGKCAFDGLSTLKKVTFGKTIGSIGKEAFVRTGISGKITFNGSVGSIGERAFADLDISGLSFGGSIGSIERSAFQGSQITVVEFTGDVESIGDGAFADMQELTKVTFSKSVGAIGKEAFMNCSSLTGSVVLKGTKVVDESAFSGCNKLKEIDLGGDLTSIGGFSFKDCSALESIHIPATVTSIDPTAFDACYGISKVTYDAESMREFVENLFPDVIFMKADSKDEEGHSGREATLYAPKASLIEAQMTAPWNRFYKIVCKDGSVTHTTKTDPVASGGLGLIFGKLSDTYCEVVGTTEGGAGLKEITVPATVESNGTTYTVVQIGREAFKGNTILEKIELPNTLLSIGSHAFKGCQGLEEVNIPDPVYRIGVGAFQGCWAISRLTIPSALTQITDSLFIDCAGLAEVKLHEKLTAIGKSAFENCYHLHEFQVAGEMHLTSIGVRAFKNCNDLISLDISESVSFIRESAFENCSKLDNVTLPAALKKLENKTFANCDRITSMNIGNSVTEIGDSVFYDCAMLKEVTVPVSVIKIGVGVFDACSELTDIYLYSANPALIGKQRFDNPDCRVYVQTKDYAKYQKSWENNLYVAVKTESDANIAFDPSDFGLAGDPVKVENPVETQPGDRVTAAITMKLENMRNQEGKNIIESYITPKATRQLARYYPEAKASFSTVAPVKHSHEGWSSKEKRVAVPADTIGNISIKGVGPATVRVETENNYYHEYDIKIFPRQGDANWNGGFDISDAVNIAQYVVKNRANLTNWNTWMGGNWEYYYLPGADVNSDDIISVSDASAAVKLALAEPVQAAAPAAAFAAAGSGNGALVIGNPVEESGVWSVPVAIEEELPFVALQADITVPEGMALEDVKAATGAGDHKLIMRRIDSRTVRIALFDIGCSEFAGGDEPLLELLVAGKAVEARDITISGIVASDVSSQNYHLSSKIGNISTGIENIETVETEESDGFTVRTSTDGLILENARGKKVSIYSIDGRVVKSTVPASDAEQIDLYKGIYIVAVEGKSKKVLVK